MSNGGPLNERGLTVKQEAFLQHFLTPGTLSFGNATESANQVYQTNNRDTAKSMGTETLSKPYIKKEISRRLKKILTGDQVMEELSDIASADWRDFLSFDYGPDGQVVNVKLKLSDKLRALELTGKYHRLFAERIESMNYNVNVSVDLEGFSRQLEKIGQERFTTEDTKKALQP